MALKDENFQRHIVNNPYPGRGLVVGRSSNNCTWLLIYWIMGRSEHSRNRRFVAENDVLRTEAVDPSLVENPSLIIYEPMVELNGIYVVTNGDQTATISEFLKEGKTFDEALVTREREPDAPNYTPRISGMLNLRLDPPEITLNILKASIFDPEHTDGTTFRPTPPPPGTGVGLTTYMGDGQPLPSYRGDPLPLPCEGAPEEVLSSYWKALDADNRLSLAVKQ
ncbi:uncharacterized protein METZ01_LOCUS278784, partial [marine metagenome]